MKYYRMLLFHLCLISLCMKTMELPLVLKTERDTISQQPPQRSMPTRATLADRKVAHTLSDGNLDLSTLSKKQAQKRIENLLNQTKLPADYRMLILKGLAFNNPSHFPWKPVAAEPIAPTSYPHLQPDDPLQELYQSYKRSIDKATRVKSTRSPFLTLASARQLEIWNLEKPANRPQRYIFEKKIRPRPKIAISKDNRLIAVEYSHDEIALFDTSSTRKTPWTTLHGHRFITSALKISPDNSKILAVTLDGVIHLCDTTKAGNYIPINHLSGHTGGLTALKISNNNRYALSAGKDTTVILWDLDIAKKIKEYATKSPPTSLAFSPDNSFIFVGVGNTICCACLQEQDAQLNPIATKLGTTRDAITKIRVSVDNQSLVYRQGNKTYAIARCEAESDYTSLQNFIAMLQHNKKNKLHKLITLAHLMNTT